MPQLNAADWPPQLFWLAVTFLTLYFIVSRMVIPGVGGTILARKSRIEGDLAAAQRLKSDTDKAIADYEAAIAVARTEAGGIGREAREALTAEADRARHALDAELGAKIAEAEMAVAAAKARALSDIHMLAADIAADIVTQLIGVKAGRSALAAAVTKAQVA